MILDLVLSLTDCHKIRGQNNDDTLGTLQLLIFVFPSTLNLQMQELNRQNVTN